MITTKNTSMRILAIARTLFFCVGTTVAATAADTTLDPHLEPLRPLLDKTWRGPFKDSKPDKPTVDIAHWERALNGQAVRMLHSINDGVYGGETIIMWDQKKQSVCYHYFTTAGFKTTGTMSFDKGQVTTHEEVVGSTDGITEVRGTSEIGSDGTFHVKTEYLKNGQWVPGHEVTYRPDPSAQVVFK
jgi:hypothetical protein